MLINFNFLLHIVLVCEVSTLSTMEHSNLKRTDMSNHAEKLPSHFKLLIENTLPRMTNIEQQQTVAFD